MASIVGEIDNTLDIPGQRAPLVTGGHDFSSLTDTVAAVWEAPRPPRAWYIAFGISVTLLAILGLMIGYLIITGVGVWGLNIPTAGASTSPTSSSGSASATPAR